MGFILAALIIMTALEAAAITLIAREILALYGILGRKSKILQSKKNFKGGFTKWLKK